MNESCIDTPLVLTCSKLTIKLTIEMLEQGVTERCKDIFIVNFEHISHLVLAFLLLTLNT